METVASQSRGSPTPKSPTMVGTALIWPNNAPWRRGGAVGTKRLLWWEATEMQSHLSLQHGLAHSDKYFTCTN